jgi:hypothetical protein
MAKAKLRLIAPTTVDRTVAPRRHVLRTPSCGPGNTLTPAEVEALIETAGKNRQGRSGAWRRSRRASRAILSIPIFFRRNEICALPAL